MTTESSGLGLVADPRVPGSPPRSEVPRLDAADREQLFAWVRARMAAHLEGWQDSHETVAAYLADDPEARCDVAGEVADDLSWNHEGPDEDTPAWALCVAAGWPS